MDFISIGGNSRVIGISYRQMSLVKSDLKRAKDRSNEVSRKVNGAKLKLQVDAGSSRVRVASEDLYNHYKELAKRQTKIDRMINNIDYAVRRYREVDARCAARIRSIGRNYRAKEYASKKFDEISSIFSSGMSRLGNGLLGGAKSLWESGKSAFSSFCGSVSNWMDRHPTLVNIGSIVLEGIGVVAAVAAVIVGGPVLAVGAAVVGGIFAANRLIDSGIKLYNNIRNESNDGFNLIEKGFQSVFGKEGGKNIYETVDMVAGVLDFAIAAKNIPRIVKNIPSMVKKIPSMIENGIDAFKSFANIDRIVDGIKDIKVNMLNKMDRYKKIAKSTIDNTVETFKDMGDFIKDTLNGSPQLAMDGFGSVRIPDEEFKHEKTINKIVNDGIEGTGKAESLLGKVDFTKLDSNGVKDLMNNVSKSGLSAEDKILANIEIYNKALEQGIKVDSQVIASPKFIDSSGWIKWPEQSGYTIDAITGKAIKYEVVPQNGNIIDRYGATNGTFTSPIIDNMSIPYEQRALPYIDNKNAYHQYKVTRDFNELSEAIKNCKDKDLVELINADALRYGIDLDNLKTYGGEIAPAFEAIGGGTQWQLPLSVEYLKKLGFVKEIK